MRVLYINPNAIYLNPTANLLGPLFVQHFNDVVFYGPGYVSEADLRKGIRRFVDRSGPFDVVVLGNNALTFNDVQNNYKLAQSVCRNSASRFTPEILSIFFSDIRKNCGDIPIPIKLWSTITLDYYASTQALVDFLLEKSISIIGPNEQFTIALEDLPDYAKREKHYLRKRDLFSNAWRDFLISHPEKVITALHFVDTSEYCFNVLASRPYDTSIPGVEYVLRSEAHKILKNTKYRLPSKIYFNLYRLASHCGFPVFSNPVLLRLYNLLFQRSLADTKLPFTARGGFGIPIRKFFEIPASGGLMICTSPNGFSELGFVDEVNYIESTPDKLPDMINEWLNTDKAQTVARKGQDLVIQKHSLKARSEQIASCIKAMVNGKYLGSRWSDGEHVIKVKGDKKSVV